MSPEIEDFIETLGEGLSKATDAAFEKIKNEPDENNRLAMIDILFTRTAYHAGGMAANFAIDNSHEAMLSHIAEGMSAIEGGYREVRQKITAMEEGEGHARH